MLGTDLERVQRNTLLANCNGLGDEKYRAEAALLPKVVKDGLSAVSQYIVMELTGQEKLQRRAAVEAALAVANPIKKPNSGTSCGM